MISTTEMQSPCIVICHFKNEELHEKAGGRLIRYQVTIDPNNDNQLSPSGEFIRFGDVKGDEITGWQPCINIVVDETLFTYEQEIPYNNNVMVRGAAA